MARQIASKGGSGDFWKVVGGIATIAGAVALFVKATSKNHKCPECDNVLKVVNALQMICPACGVVSFKA
jgi:hypothetical protein